jgi:hypothetical protein
MYPKFPVNLSLTIRAGDSQSAEVPVCSTVLLPSPSRPTQKLEYVVADVQLAVGCFQLAETLV